MREKYNKFRIDKINKKTIELALQLREKGDYKEAYLKNPEINNIPVDKDRFLGFLSVKYLQLKPEEGIPLLKQAFKKQFKVEDECKICQYCHKPFIFTRQTKKFCSHRCQVRYHRHSPQKKTETVTLRAKSIGG